jgi:hypothetical protein
MEGLYSATVLGFSVYLILWLFVIYSFLGVLVEMIFCLVQEGVLESRVGLLYLPLRPMYGVGGVACTVLLHRFIQEPILIFLWGMLICTVVEYVASFVMEKAFSAVTWDYSDKALNLHGRICLQYSCCWGLLVLLVLCARPIPLRSRGSVWRPGRRNCPYSADDSRAAVPGGYPGRSGSDPQARRRPQGSHAR